MKINKLLAAVLFLGIAGLVIAQDEPAKNSTEENKPAEEASYIGVDKCKMCHAKQHVTWQKMKHSKAVESLTAEEQKKPECVKCHVTGYGEKGGFESIEKTPKMVNVQCEACHGPGSNHMKAPVAEKKKTISRTGVDCKQCHSPHVDVGRKKTAEKTNKK